MDRLPTGFIQKAASPIAAPIPRLSTPPFLPTTPTGPSPKPISKPASTVPVDIDPQSQAHADTLASLGIKVRDFAYESKLPPVRSFRFRQIQPGPPALKRVRTEIEDDENIFYSKPKSGTGEGSSSKKSKLEREATEPNLQMPSNNNPVRTRCFYDLNDYEPESQSVASNSQQSEWETSQIPPRYLESEDSEQYIDTPLVTPNGSLQWRVENTSDMLESQLDTESHVNEPELLSYSQLGMSSPADTTGTGLYGTLTPMSSLSSISSNPPLPSPKSPHQDSIQLLEGGSPLSESAQQPRSSNKSPSHSKPTKQQLRVASRYQLRKRSAPTFLQSPTKPSTRARHSMYPHPIPFPVQPPHTKSKSQASSVSPHLRKRTVVPGGRDDAMIVR